MLKSQAFIPYYVMGHAEEMTSHQQSGSRGHMVRQHASREARNFTCAHMKRSDPVTRRFIQYIAMKTSFVCILVRDGKTGRIIQQPPDSQLWLLRHKAGLGRASKNEWVVDQQIGEAFFEDMEKRRTWRFGFNDFYDVYIWDLRPGNDFLNIYRTIHETLYKARRILEPKGALLHLKPVLDTITRDPITKRARDLRPGSDEESIFQRLTGSKAQHMFGNAFKTHSADDLNETLDPKLAYSLFYNEADALEDSILFPDEFNPSGLNPGIPEFVSKISRFETEGPEIRRFMYDLDIDEDLPDDLSGEEEELNSTGDSQEYVLDSELDADHDDWEDDEDDWEDEERRTESKWDTGASELLSKHFMDECFPKRSGTHNYTPSFPPGFEELDKVLRKWSKKNKKNPAYGKKDMRADFEDWQNRERARRKCRQVCFTMENTLLMLAVDFRNLFHSVDLDPKSVAAYNEWTKLAKAIEQHEMYDYDRAAFCLLTLDFLDISPDFHKYNLRETVRAYAMLAPFFHKLKMAGIEKFLATEHGAPFKDSLLLKPDVRAKDVPNRRTHMSNHHMPKDFWKEWKAIENGTEELAFAYPKEWDKFIRPILAKCNNLFPITLTNPTNA